MIIFLGAGASRAFEVPTMREFIEKITAKVKSEANTKQELFLKIKQSKFTAPFDLEILMTVLNDLKKPENELSNTSSPFTNQLLHNYSDILDFKDRINIANALLKDVKKIIAIECKKPLEDKLDKIEAVYDNFFRMSNNFLDKLRSRNKLVVGVMTLPKGGVNYHLPLTIFTTNYDTIMEAYLHKKQIDFNDGMYHSCGVDIFDPNMYQINLPSLIRSLSIDSNISTAISTAKDFHTVELFKLHGSISYVRTKEGNIFNDFRFEKEGVTNIGAAIEDEIMWYPLESTGYEYISQSPFLELFNIFKDRLKRDNIWIIIGFSFRDKNISGMFNDVARSNRDVIAILIDPQSENIKNELKKNFRYLAEKITPINGKFGDEEILEKLSAFTT